MEGPSAAERRRAARQRKILVNAENRMNRLYGRPDGAGTAAGSDAAAPAMSTCSEPCPDPPDQSIDEVLGQSGPPPALEELLRQMNGRQEGVGAGQQSAGQGANGGSPPGTWWQRWDKHRWLVVALLALAVRLATLAGVGAALTQNLLLPFFLLETSVYVVRLWSVPLRTNMGLLGTALMLCGVSPRTLDLWGRYITFLSQAWNDFMVYMFFVVVSFSCGGGADLAADTRTRASDGVQEVAAPPSPSLDDHVEFEF